MNKQADPSSPTTPEQSASSEPKKEQKKKRSKWKIAGVLLLILVLLGIAARLALPTGIRWYVNRTLAKNPLYHGRIDDIDVHLLRGAYTIRNITITKITGDVPVPFFSAKEVDLALESKALLHRSVVGRITINSPELNFVDAPDESSTQTGGGAGPWLGVIKELFPFKINSAIIHNGSVHFRAFQTKPPVDVYLANLELTAENLTNVQDTLAPLASTVKATAVAMESGQLELQLKLDPFSYNPTFQLGLRLLSLDVTKTNDLARAYGQFDFERGWFDLVIELDAKEGQIDGYIKPLFRNLKVFVLRDAEHDNPLQFFWEALVGATTDLIKNHPRDQFGTVIPMTGSFSSPDMDYLAVIGNVLRNAFIRAYLPRLVGRVSDINNLQFSPARPYDSPVNDHSSEH